MLNISEEVLGVLVTQNIDHKDIVTKLAIHYPNVLMELLHVDDLTYQIQQAYSTPADPGPHMVSAIKKYRELTGTGLKDAKLAVERLIDQGHVKNLVGSKGKHPAFPDYNPSEYQSDD